MEDITRTAETGMLSGTLGLFQAAGMWVREPLQIINCILSCGKK